jgi:hypothetical protein
MSPRGLTTAPHQRLETLEAVLARLCARGDPELRSLILDLEERIRLTVRELTELEPDVADLDADP